MFYVLAAIQIFLQKLSCESNLSWFKKRRNWSSSAISKSLQSHTHKFFIHLFRVILQSVNNLDFDAAENFKFLADCGIDFGNKYSDSIQIRYFIPSF